MMILMTWKRYYSLRNTITALQEQVKNLTNENQKLRDTETMALSAVEMLNESTDRLLDKITKMEQGIKNEQKA